jgi:hypothetical protein
MTYAAIASASDMAKEDAGKTIWMWQEEADRPDSQAVDKSSHTVRNKGFG